MISYRCVHIYVCALVSLSTHACGHTICSYISTSIVHVQLYVKSVHTNIHTQCPDLYVSRFWSTCVCMAYIQTCMHIYMYVYECAIQFPSFASILPYIYSYIHVFGIYNNTYTCMYVIYENNQQLMTRYSCCVYPSKCHRRRHAYI